MLDSLGHVKRGDKDAYRNYIRKSNMRLILINAAMVTAIATTILQNCRHKFHNANLKSRRELLIVLANSPNLPKNLKTFITMTVKSKTLRTPKIPSMELRRIEG